jgi:hypothetical protein
MGFDSPRSHMDSPRVFVIHPNEVKWGGRRGGLGHYFMVFRSLLIFQAGSGLDRPILMNVRHY